MGRFRAIHGLIKLLILFFRSLLKGEPWAVWVLVGILGLGLLSGFVWLAKRPLGGDPEKNPAAEDALRDDKNPYRGEM